MVKKNPDLVSVNIRGAAMGLTDFLTPYETYMCWARFEFFHPDTPNPEALKDNPNLYSSLEIGQNFSKRVDWGNQEEASRGLRALSQMLRNSDYSDWEGELRYEALIQDLSRACREDGFRLSLESQRIEEPEGVPLDLLDLSNLPSIDGVTRKVKKLNRALTIEHDYLEVVGYAKDVIEAVAAAILSAMGMKDSEIIDLRVMERASKVHKMLGIGESGGALMTSEAFESVRRGLNKMVQGVADLRSRQTDSGHGMNEVPELDKVTADLAVDSAIAWCRYVLGVYNQRQISPF
ncbi:abortive infection family protein [Corynebacterium amycolatum]|uniref:abortive infection family protein n=1 Tax=Corynebacterium amycolatum TaxID=43765 RepID=UPI00396B1F8B